MSTITEKELLEEIRSIRKTLEHIEALLEERLIGVEEPLPDEIEEIEKYEAEKREGKLEPIKLNELLKELEETSVKTFHLSLKSYF